MGDKGNTNPQTTQDTQQSNIHVNCHYLAMRVDLMLKLYSTYSILYVLVEYEYSFLHNCSSRVWYHYHTVELVFHLLVHISIYLHEYHIFNESN